MAANIAVVYDACVLYPAPLRDLLVQLATTRIFRANWTELIHDEWTRNLLIKRPDLNVDVLSQPAGAVELPPQCGDNLISRSSSKKLETIPQLSRNIGASRSITVGNQRTCNRVLSCSSVTFRIRPYCCPNLVNCQTFLSSRLWNSSFSRA